MPLRINPFNQKFRMQSGVSLIEMIVFMLVVSIALLALVGVYQQATVGNVDPVIRVRALEAAQSTLDEILLLKYDGNTPTGGIPACNSGAPNAVACNNVTDGDLNDVDDYDGWSDTPYPGYARHVRVTTNNNIKVIRVSVTTPTGDTMLLSAERANF